jgi:SAM-dependent methyltransferase
MYLKNYFVRLGKNLLVRFPKTVARFFEYAGEFARFKKGSQRFSVNVADMYPCLHDKMKTTPFDEHYTYHPAWAARRIIANRPAYHVDISSILSFGTMLSSSVPVRFYDYRPAAITLSNYESHFGDLNALPFDDHSVASLSCMHTIEHIGLGRYGDVLDGEGDLKAISELKRVLAHGGDLFFVTPVGSPRIEFNAHRVYSFEQVIEYFAPLTLHEFSMVPDSGGLIEHADPAMVRNQRYACGCFWFKK